jgi:Psb28 protein
VVITLPSAGSRPGLFMIDDEGTLSTTDVKAKFVNGKPQAIEAKYSMRSQFEWDRFIRFMDRHVMAPACSRAGHATVSIPLRRCSSCVGGMCGCRMST